MRVMLRVLPLALLLAACSFEKHKPAIDRDTLSRRQRDSLTARSMLPGAPVVGKALDAADAEAAHAAAIDSLSR